ncbi:hypothetical protein FHS15_005190 [Paenibacillus castaneae]|uniref:hypothetical protein n=1 Tax=Paenibacillus castaneae TaxID=474957 RepID=UPI000C9B0F6A|nr:hypothetical protein [Paenibacillus castaneae]NIK80006.1 hypothetical protein [Paenibacillus castaneae]
MALALMIIITAVIGTTVMLIYGIASIKRIVIPLLMLFVGDFLLLYAKFVAGDDFLTIVLYLPAGIILLVSLIWLLILFIQVIVRKESKKKIFAILLSFIMTTVIVTVPSLTQIDKMKMYQSDYFLVSNAIFQAYDEGQIAVGL